MLYNLSSSSLIIYLNVLESVKLISCWDLKSEPLSLKSERENFNIILKVLYLFASKTLEQWSQGGET